MAPPSPLTTTNNNYCTVYHVYVCFFCVCCNLDRENLHGRPDVIYRGGHGQVRPPRAADDQRGETILHTGRRGVHGAREGLQRGCQNGAEGQGEIKVDLCSSAVHVYLKLPSKRTSGSFASTLYLLPRIWERTLRPPTSNPTWLGDKTLETLQQYSSIL